MVLQVLVFWKPSTRVLVSFYQSFKAKSQRAIRLHSCESIFIIFAPSYVNFFSRQNRFKSCNLHHLVYIFLDNGVMTTPKRRILSFVFTVLCINNIHASNVSDNYMLFVVDCFGT